jgi:hypothetical protein
MVRTTRAPRFDVIALFPDLAGLAERTVRLHPRRGPEPAVNASKLGGRFLWPAGEEWPVCTEPEWRREGDDSPPHEHLFVPVLQLRRDDFPELHFPGDADLFQLLWCPNDHEITLSPVCRVFWRKEAEVTDPLIWMSAPAPVEEEYLPRPCCLHPERVTEYPGPGELPDDLAEVIRRWEVDCGQEATYELELSVAPGTKLGGYVDWIQGAGIPHCECGHPMEHLLTVASSEFSGGGWQRWCPMEDVQTTGMSLDELQAGHAWLDELKEIDRSTGIMLSDMGSLYVFICRGCPDWPITWELQSH